MNRTPGNEITRIALQHIREHGPTPIGELCDEIGCDRSALKRYLQALVDGGVIYFKKGEEDGRKKLVCLGEEPSAPVVYQHHGRCDVCEGRHVKVTHFNYHDRENGFRVCEGCRLLKSFRIRSVLEAGIE